MNSLAETSPCYVSPRGGPTTQPSTGTVRGTAAARLGPAHPGGAELGVGRFPFAGCGVALLLSVILFRAASVTAQSPVPDAFNPGGYASDMVFALALQADGKILVGGSFTTLGGRPRQSMGRLNLDGTLDTGFNPPAAELRTSVMSVVLQADGKILVGGDFTTLGGQPRYYLGRLNPDGMLDRDFNPGADFWVEALALQADGKILVGGQFRMLGGQARSSIGRLHPDGSLDRDFDPGVEGRMVTLALQADGKILVGGNFSTLDGQPRNSIGRLHPDGSLDRDFDPGVEGFVGTLAVQADGKILVGGRFSGLGGQPRNSIGRLNPDGTLDHDFAAGADNDVISLTLQADGKILVGGNFSTLDGQPRSSIGRLNPDGTLDHDFDPGANGGVWALAVQADGKILVGGRFSGLGGQPRNSIGRLNNTEGATQSLNNDGAIVTWLRGGTSPEVWRTMLDWSHDGLLWAALGDGTRLAGGWQWLSTIVPRDATIRARGWVTGGERAASGWFVEDYWGAPAWSAQPTGRTNDAGTTATFWAKAEGTPPLSYQWLKDGMALADGGLIAGATTAWLTLSNVGGADAGGYQLAVRNAFGARTSQVANLTVIDPAIAEAPVSQNRELGQGVTFQVTASGTAPLVYQWWKDGVELAGQADAFLTLTNLGAADAGGYWVVVGSPHGAATSTVAWLTVNQAAVDTEFNPGANGMVASLALQPDGKILVGGDFTTLDGRPRSRIGRLNPNGMLDPGFNPEANGMVAALVLQPDGKLLVGGYFTTLCGHARNGIGRLNPDGTLDLGFNPGPNRYVLGLALQSDRKILVGGDFTTLGGQPREKIGRLNPDGTLDLGFNPGRTDQYKTVLSLAVQSDGKVLVGGDFTTLGGQPRKRIGRLNSDGTLDLGFDPGTDGSVLSLVVQPEGKILVGGQFTTLGGQPRDRIGRLNPDGTLDDGFNPGADVAVASLVLQADEKILVGGYFTTLGGQPRDGIGRLNPDGTLDYGFNPGADGAVLSLALHGDGRILTGGYFTTLGGQPRSEMGRINNTEPATQSLSYDGARVTWLRGGASPEVWHSTVEWSSDGLLWTALGGGARVPGGWQWLEAVGLSDTMIRARGFIAGGYHNGSGWFVEDYWGPVAWIAQPVSRTNEVGTTASFWAATGGTPLLSYQWFKDGTALANGGPIAGATTASLTLSNVVGGDAGGYRLVVSNAYGARTSVVATLTVDDPVIVDAPVSHMAEVGESVTFHMTARGTAPLAYQWWKDGVALEGQTGGSLTLTNLGTSDAGGYWGVVSGPSGSATSRVAWLTVNGATLDTEFNPSAGGSPGEVYSLVLQGDGRILVGGSFTTLVGQTRHYIGRLNPDGKLDTEFDPGANRAVASLALQADGKILVGGEFLTLGGQPRSRIGRLNVDGTLDPGFNPGVDGLVESWALQADGKILVGGSFNTLGGQPRKCIGRLNPDGSLDTEFNPGANNSVRATALQADGKVLVGGDFTTLGGQTRNYIGRLNPDGSLDTEFNPGADRCLLSLAVQADGRILVGGIFGTLGGQTRKSLGRLNSDGTLDIGFAPEANSSVSCLALQVDGKILVGGDFTTLEGQARNSMGRLNPDGTLDPGFNPGVGPVLFSLAVQADGKVLVGGRFSTLRGQPRKSIGRLNNTEPATQSLSYDGTSVTWLRGGTGPEVWRTTFEGSSDGLLWAALGEGQRIPGGWELPDVLVGADQQVRARGFIPSGGQVVTVLIPGQGVSPEITQHPQSLTITAGQTATLTVVVVGTEPLRFQWFAGATGDTRHPMAGATGASFTTPVLHATTSYWVRVTNNASSAESQTALVTVTLPAPPSLRVARLASGTLQITMTGPVGSRWQLRRSVDLVTWQTLETVGTVELSSGQATVEVRTEEFSVAFYLLTSLP